MDNLLNDYLNKVDKYLRPMAASDRSDIVQEIKSEAADLKANDGLTEEQIIERLGDPRSLAKSYLGDSIAKTGGMNFKKVSLLIAFYGATGLSGMFVLPFTSVASVGFMFCGVIAPLAGLLKLVCSFFGYTVPFVVMDFGVYKPEPLPAFLLSLFVGAVIFAMGYGLWRVMKAYIKAVSKGYARLHPNE